MFARFTASPAAAAVVVDPLTTASLTTAETNGQRSSQNEIRPSKIPLFITIKVDSETNIVHDKFEVANVKERYFKIPISEFQDRNQLHNN